MLASAEPGETLAAALTRQLRAISPQIAREVAFRVAGDAGVTIQALPADAGASVAREVRHLLEPLVTATWSPQVYRDQDGEVIAFCANPTGASGGRLSGGGGGQRESRGGAGRGAADAGGRHVQRRERLSAAVREARERVAARLASMREERARAGEAERYREWGELIFAYLWTLQPGQRELVAEGMTIPLDPTLTGKENAQRYFERYRKAQGAAERLPELEEGAERELAYLDQLLTQVAQAERFEELESLAAEWDAHQRATGQRAAGSRPYRRSTPPRKPRAIYDDRGNAIYVGRSGTENDAITFDVAGPNDTWLHARGVPGSHVVVRWRDASGEEDEDTLRLAAALAAYYSAARDSTLVEVDLTRRRFVRKIKGAGPGLVSYRNERTIAVRPADDPRLRAR